MAPNCVNLLLTVEQNNIMAACSRCGFEHFRVGQRYCHGCHAWYMREHRPKHRDLSPEQRKKANCRSYAKTYRDRGKITQQPCETCGSVYSQMHHADYDQPLKVTWLCRPCHLAHHKSVVEHIGIYSQHV